jgi:GT2 family glycosyltransferase
MAMPRAIFDRTGPWNEELGRKGDARGTWEDLDFADRVRNSGGQVWFCPEAVIHHRIMPQRALPRPMLRYAFRRGRNDYLRSVWASAEPGGAPISHLERAGAVLTMSAYLIGWISWTMLFRISRRRRAFDAARGAAWSAGWRMMKLTLRRAPGAGPLEPPFQVDDGAARTIAKACGLAQRVAIRLAPLA